MGGDFKVLRDAIRKPMLRWWLRYGVWWVGAAAGLQILHFLMLYHIGAMLQASSTGQLLGYDWILSGTGFASSALFAVGWLLAAVYCRKLVTEFLDEGTVYEQARYAPQLFRLAYSQGLFLVLLVWLIKFSNEISMLIRMPSFFQNQSSWLVGINICSKSAYAPLPLAISMIWLIGLLAILPRRTWPAWGLLSVNYGVSFIGSIAMYIINWENYDFNSTQFDPSPYGWWLGPAVIIGMFLSFRAIWFKLAWVLYGLLATCIFAVVLYPLYLIGSLDNSQLQIVYLPNYIGLAYNYVPQFGIHAWASTLQQQRLSHGTVLVHLIPLVPIMVSLLWPVAMYALMYYVLLRPWRKADVTAE